jgi:hypothetical protein
MTAPRGLAFSIAPSAATVQPDAEGRAEITYTVTNNLPRAVKARARVTADDAAPEDRIEIDGRAERLLAAESGIEQYKVVATVALPPAGEETPARQVKIQFDVVDVEDQNTNWTRGPAVTLDIPPGKGADVKRFPWWIAAAAAAVLIIAGGAAWWLWPRDDTSLVSVVGLTLEDARAELNSRNFRNDVVRADSLTGEVAPGTVLRQEPDTGSAEAASEEFLSDTNRVVRLWVEGESRRVPPLLNLSLLQVPQVAQDAGILLDSIRLTSTSDSTRHFKVRLQAPDPNTLIPPDQKVQLTVWNYTGPCTSIWCMVLVDSLRATVFMQEHLIPQASMSTSPSVQRLLRDRPNLHWQP